MTLPGNLPRAADRPDPLHAAPPADVESRLAAYRDRVLPLIRESVPQREPRKYLYDLVDAHMARAGKGLRPALCLATCRAFGGSDEQALPSAAALEVLHNAFLVHDDVEDGSEYRRDRPTMHRQYGVPIAVNAGDAMNALSLRILRRNLALHGPETTWRVFDEFDHMMMETMEGQAMELGWIRDNDCTATDDDYLLMVLKKTCWYSFIHPCRVGALVSGNAGPARGNLDAFNRFGYFLGAAFQIQDDVLNLKGDRGKYGKEIGGDLLEGKRTLVLAHLFRSCEPQEKQRLKAFFAKPRAQRLPRDVAWIYDLLGRHGSIEYARSAARQLVEAARREFDGAYGGATPGPDLTFLRDLLGYMVARDA
ncbi:MAG TPA: polyprenyl synthetase family protein [Polyangiaceae bacterium]|jgi:geranylgeranyl diphosphate synthase type II|nr:polyprenyl synthetase family protein [Polyangiaceae bacterium]